MKSVQDNKNILISGDVDQKITLLYTLMHAPEKKYFLNELLLCAKDKNKDVRLASIMILDKINNKKIMPVLEEVINDEFKKIKIAAALALAKYKNKTAIPILVDIIEKDIKDHSIHKRAIECLGKFESMKLLGLFEKTLKHRRKASKLKAIEAIGKIKTKRSLEILLNFAQTEKDVRILPTIKSALRNLGDLS
jgi:HEAT repeat protein